MLMAAPFVSDLASDPRSAHELTRIVYGYPSEALITGPWLA
jgi:hypothetical protein